MLTKVNIIGFKYVHFFVNEEGHLLEVETTKEDYEQLGTSTPVNPTPPKGFTWVSSVTRMKYDTPSGDLEDNQYADEIVRHVKLPNKLLAINQVSVVEDADALTGFPVGKELNDDTTVKADIASVEYDVIENP